MSLCEICGSNHLVQSHHAVSGNGKRKQHESTESMFNLCWDCHHGTKGVHGRDGRGLAVKLKQITQERYKKQGFTEEEIREKMGGKLY